MNNKIDYETNRDIKFSHLQKIDITQMVEDGKDKRFNQALTIVNDSVIRMAVAEGEYHWHKHTNDDEFFYVVEGQFFIDLEDRTIELNPNQGATISKGIMHRTRAPKKTVILMVETSAIQPTGD
jgi:mannose-6-phosphate isomerase-like protein (cupin superfamily)